MISLSLFQPRHYVKLILYFRAKVNNIAVLSTMDIEDLHSWPSNYESALKLQRELANRVSLVSTLNKNYRLVAGADVSSVRSQGRLWAVVVILKLPEMEIIERAFASRLTEFPYIPGLLSFREAPVLIEAMKKIKTVPDAVICDGQGLAHPRSFGLACHLGLWLNLPTIGCAKSRLVGEAPEPGSNPGDWKMITHNGRDVGTILRTRKRSKPVFVSPGHKIDIQTARDVVAACIRGSRLPEPTRLAHLIVNEYRKESQEAY